jgi:hypothetical protein
VELPEAVHEEDLRARGGGFKRAADMEKRGREEKGVRTWLRRSMVSPLPLWVVKKRM